MNEFEVGGVTLPPGCKDLIDVLRLPGRNRAAPPAPRRGGMADLESWVQQLFDDSAASKMLIITWPHQADAVHLFWRAGTLSIQLHLGYAGSSHEQAVRSIFMEAGIAPIADEIRSPLRPGRLLDYPLPTAPVAATELLQDLLLRGCVAPESFDLVFHYFDGSSQNA